MRPLLILLCLSMLSGSWFAQPDPELVVVADEPFVFRPSVSAELTWDSPRSPVGWGSFDLTAAPEHDEIRVDDDRRYAGLPASVPQLRTTKRRPSWDRLLLRSE